MKLLSPKSAQRGATLVVSLILLTLMTLMVTTAFTLTTSNLKSVSNMRFRNEAIAAANIAIEQKIGSLCPSPCTTAPAADSINVDINRDNTTDYTVTINSPTCVKASLSTNGSRSSVSLGSGMSSGDYWNTVWDIDATVIDPLSGASIKIRSGTRLLLSQTQKNTVCP